MRNEFSALISCLLSMTLILGVVGIAAPATFYLAPYHALVVGVVALISIGFGGKGVSKTYNKLSDEEWHPDVAKGLFNMQALFAILTFWIVFVSIAI
jgi:hypothetical protein